MTFHLWRCFLDYLPLMFIKNTFNYRPPQNHHSNQNNCTKTVLFFTSFFHTGWQFLGLHPEKLAKVSWEWGDNLNGPYLIDFPYIQRNNENGQN